MDELSQPEVQSFCYTDESGETYEIFIESKSNPEITETGGSGREGRGSGPTSIQIQEASRMIRGYAAYAVGAFKNFSAAKIDGVTLKFGLKIGGKVGIPYITEGSTESNLEIEVKCSFPDNP